MNAQKMYDAHTMCKQAVCQIMCNVRTTVLLGLCNGCAVIM